MWGGVDVWMCVCVCLVFRWRIFGLSNVNEWVRVCVCKWVLWIIRIHYSLQCSFTFMKSYISIHAHWACIYFNHSAQNIISKSHLSLQTIWLATHRLMLLLMLLPLLSVFYWFHAVFLLPLPNNHLLLLSLFFVVVVFLLFIYNIIYSLCIHLKIVLTINISMHLRLLLVVCCCCCFPSFSGYRFVISTLKCGSFGFVDIVFCCCDWCKQNSAVLFNRF